MYTTYTNETLNRRLAHHFQVAFNEIVRVQEWAQVWWVHVKGKRPTLVSKKVIAFKPAFKPAFTSKIKTQTIRNITVTDMSPKKVGYVVTCDWQTHKYTYLSPQHIVLDGIYKKMTYEIDLTVNQIVMAQEANTGNTHTVQTWYVVKNGVMSVVDNYTDAALELLGVQTCKISILGVSRRQSDYGLIKVKQALVSAISYCKEKGSDLDKLIERINLGFVMDAKVAIESPNLMKILLTNLRKRPQALSA